MYGAIKNNPAVERGYDVQRFFFGAAGFLGAGLAAGRLPLAGALGGALGGGAVGFPCLGGMARMRHLGPEPMRSSRWAVKSASFTKK